MNQTPLYLDHSASTPLDPVVFEAMQSYWMDDFGNASSQHAMGWKAQMAVDRARGAVAQVLGASSKREIIFTSGASESNTLALLGHTLSLLRDQRRTEGTPSRLHALTSTVEHKSVLATFEQMEALGVAVEYLSPNRFGQIDPNLIEDKIRPETVLMSFMWANNEVGSLNPMTEIAGLANKHNICLHSDATQAVGKLPIDLAQVPIDMLSLSGHKMYGPKGIGALFTRRMNNRLKFPLTPLIQGGDHEYGLRAGTLNVPAIVGLGRACELATETMDSVSADLRAKADYLFNEIKTIYPSVRLNGHPTDRIPGHLHLTFSGLRWDQWLPRMSHFCVSATSACNSASNKGSHVLQGLGFSTQEIEGSLRMTLGKGTTADILQRTITLLKTALPAIGPDIPCEDN